jgi:hypothetical protein
MAAATIQIAGVQTTNAQFTAWAQNISSHFTSAGMVQTLDSGQINWATVATPSATRQKMGYEIWKFADAFQSTSPVFVRIDYGSGGASTLPGIWLQLGSGSNGSGQLTGPISNPNMAGSNGLNIASAATVANTENCYFSGNTNYINTWMFMNKDGGVGISQPFGFSLERTKNASGADTGQGILFTAYGATVFYQTVWDCVLGQLYTHESSPGILVPALANNGINGSNIAVYPLFHSMGNAFLNPGLNLLGYFSGAIANNTNTTVSVYGSDHNYITAGSAGIRQGNFRQSGVGLLLRYE